jgi:CheY-like chemotaxis protein
MSTEQIELCPASPPSAGRAAPPVNRVLVVDDSVMGQRIAGRILERRADLQAVFASDGRQALAVIARDPPDVVLTDLNMPGLNGLEVVEAIRRKYARGPVILMTAHGSEDIAIQALRAGAANYVHKKDLIEELSETLDKVLSVRAVDLRRKYVMGCLDERESRFRIDNDPALITPLSNLLQEELDATGFCDDTTRMRIGIALTEAIANALYHGNLEVSSDLRQEDERRFYSLAEKRRTEHPYRDRHIHVRTRLDREAVTYVIRDEGPGFDVQAVQWYEDDDLSRIGGRGHMLIRTFMDEVSHNPAGNQITLVKRRNSEQTASPAP